MSDWFSRWGHLWSVIVLEKSFWNTLTNRWLVPRGHSWCTLIWFMVSLHRLYWDDYSGSPQGPNDTIKVTGGVFHCRQGLMGKMWDFNRTLRSVAHPLSRILCLKQVSNPKLSSVTKAIGLSTWLSTKNLTTTLAKGLCAPPLGGEREGSIEDPVSPFSPILPVSARESF